MSFSSLIHGLNPTQTLLLAVGLAVLSYGGLVVYRLTLHPLARVPGPIIAAATGVYEGYFQLAKDGGGRYWIEVEKMHQKYGPIVRISPWEVHIKDPNWNEIYKLSSRACQPRWYYQFFGSTVSTNTTDSDQLHRTRRQALQTWFSSQNMIKNVPAVQGMVDKLHDRLLHSSGKVISLSDAYRCLTIDVATNFAFNKSFGNLDDLEFSKDFNQAIQNFGRIGLLNRHFYRLPYRIFTLIQSLPKFVSSRISPSASSLFMAMVHECAKFSLSKPTRSHEEAQDVVQSMLTSDLPPEEKNFERVLAECRSIILAGTETSATTLTSITYHALANPEIATRLLNEIKEAEKAKGAKLEYHEIRVLPYMTAVIHESLRTSNSVSGRLTRYSEVADLHYQQYSLPRGTYISICMHDTHMDPSIFPEPEKFLPDRWLTTNEAEYKKYMKYLQPWGRGARTCLGMEIAYSDLYLTITRLFGPDCAFHMKLFATELRDWDAYGDYFAPVPAPGGKGLRVLVVPKEKLV